MTHTAGPWFHMNGNEIHDQLAGYDSGGARTGNTPNRIAEVEYPYGDTEGQAVNARLMAAAPELLAALQSLASSFETALSHETSGKIWKEIAAINLMFTRAAIAKATGEQQ